METMLDRIKALVRAGMHFDISLLSDGPTVSVSVVDYRDGADCAGISSEYDWQNGGDVDATIESAVSKAERFLASEANTDEARAVEAALAVQMAEID